jgi:hypothetical protein
MGEIAEMMLEGTLCESCGCYVDNSGVCDFCEEEVPEFFVGNTNYIRVFRKRKESLNPPAESQEPKE